MVKSITLGRYFVGNSFLHRANPKIKILVTFIYVFVLFFINKICSYVFGFFVIAVLYKICKIPLKMAFDNIKSMAFILIFTGFINLFFGGNGEIIFKLWVFKITKVAVITTVFVAFRMFLLIVGMGLLTYTTLPLDLAKAIGDAFTPLKKFHFPAGEISTMISISIRFIPLLMLETEKIIFAQKSRGVDVSGKSIRKKVKFIISILVPLLVSSFKRADELAVAMESRCYRIGFSRTRYIVFKLGVKDLILFVCAIIFFVSLFVIGAFSWF